MKEAIAVYKRALGFYNDELIGYVCLHLGNYMEMEVDAKELSEWIRKAVEK